MKDKYGYIEFVDKRKLKDDGWDDQIKPEIRKPTPAEREEIVLNIIRDYSGKAIKVCKIADALAVSERTIQKVLKKLEEQGLIKRIKRCNKNNRQRANYLVYTGPDTPRSDGDLTLEELYDPDNPCGIRDWHWEEFKFIPGFYTKEFNRYDASLNYKILTEKKQELAEKKKK